MQFVKFSSCCSNWPLHIAHMRHECSRNANALQKCKVWWTNCMQDKETILI